MSKPVARGWVHPTIERTLETGKCKPCIFHEKNIVWQICGKNKTFVFLPIFRGTSVFQGLDVPSSGLILTAQMLDDQLELESRRPMFSDIADISEKNNMSDWWFGTFFIFHNIWDNPSK